MPSRNRFKNRYAVNSLFIGQPIFLLFINVRIRSLADLLLNITAMAASWSKAAIWPSNFEGRTLIVCFDPKRKWGKNKKPQKYGQVS